MVCVSSLPPSVLQGACQPDGVDSGMHTCYTRARRPDEFRRGRRFLFRDPESHRVTMRYQNHQLLQGIFGGLTARPAPGMRMLFDNDTVTQQCRTSLLIGLVPPSPCSPQHTAPGRWSGRYGRWPEALDS